jgi:hypothetical protein
MDVNFNGSLWWHNILQLYRGKKSSAQILLKAPHAKYSVDHVLGTRIVSSNIIFLKI